MIEYPLLMLFPIAMAFGGAMDLLTMTIPNRVSLLLIAGFAVTAAFAGMPFMMMANHVMAGMLLLVVGMFMFSMGWLGGGDAKLLAAAALWIGFDNLSEYLVQVSILGGLLSVAILVYRGATLPLWLMRLDWAMRLHDRKGGIPYGVALAGAALWTYPSTFWFTSLAT